MTWIRTSTQHQRQRRDIPNRSGAGILSSNAWRSGVQPLLPRNSPDGNRYTALMGKFGIIRNNARRFQFLLLTIAGTVAAEDQAKDAGLLQLVRALNSWTNLRI